MAPGRAARGLALALLGSLLAAGCTDGGKDGEDEKKKAGARTTPAPGKPAPTSSAPAADAQKLPDIDPAKAPRTPAEARALIDKVMATAESFGPDVVRRTPYENDPTTWPVLGTDCAWGLAPPPATVLATRTRNFEVPAAKGKGAMKLSAVVTVHRSVRDAEWEMADSLEEGMRCPSQQLRTGENVSNLWTNAMAEGEANQLNAHDVLNEYASFTSRESGGPQPYVWMLSRGWQFTIAVSGKAAKGYTDRDLGNTLVQGNVAMLLRLEAAVAKADEAKPDATKTAAPAKSGAAQNDAEGAR
ncbi:hypothetical protein [Streptomyces sp. NPDC050504]|uniref:hypothetical protein n=1 Tax=Streptomyces sp. NPDC050504 TaxID=3365618 RepID=UPI0037922D72